MIVEIRKVGSPRSRKTITGSKQSNLSKKGFSDPENEWVGIRKRF